MQPSLIAGGEHTDARGTLTFNNSFDASEVKRMYTLKNVDLSFIRAWQGHQIEQRWFSAVCGSFEIRCIQIDNWVTPSKNLDVLCFLVNDKNLDILHLPKGYVSSIQALEEHSKLLVMADYALGEIADEYRFEADYFNSKK